MKKRAQRNRIALFWQRVLSGLLIAHGFRHFRIDEIDPSTSSEYARASNLTVIIALVVGEDLEEAQIHFRIRKSKPIINFLELDYNNKPTKALVRNDVNKLQMRTVSIKRALARIFRIFGA